MEQSGRAPTEIPQVVNKWPKIASALPRNAQARLLGGIALLMVIVIALSGRNPPRDHKGSAPATNLSAQDPNEARLREYRASIEAQRRELAAEEAQLAQTKQAFGVHDKQRQSLASSQNSTSSTNSGANASSPERSWIAIDREKRAYQGLYSSNIALTYRKAASGGPLSGGTEVPSAPITRASGAAAVASGERFEEAHPQYTLFEGTLIETVLTNRLDSSLAGPVNCMVTTGVYSADHAKLLIPQGTRLLGEARKVESFGEQRLAVFFHRLIMPDGYVISLDRFQGLDQVGATGLRDQINHHYLQIFGASLAIGAFAGLAQADTRYSLDESAADAYRQGVASSLSQSALHVLDRYLNVLPTFTIREGFRVKVYLSQDLHLPTYDDHPVQPLL